MKKVKSAALSWSEFCRKKVQKYINQINHATVENDDIACIEWSITDLTCSCCPDILKYRIAKLLRRAICKGKIKENLECVKNYHDWINEIIKIYGFDPRYI